MRHSVLVFFLLISVAGWSQEQRDNYRTVKIPVRDTVVIDSAGINPKDFKLLDNEGNSPNPFGYKIDFKKGTIIFHEELKQQHDSLTLQYVQYPSFLTRKYYLLDPSLIVENTGEIDRLYSLGQATHTRNFTPFDGLNTSGSISRSITIGNNQNAVVNSQLDLQITGKLSDKVSIRASIQDANIPAQESGYSQSLNEFDRIFIELFGDQWNIRAGDIDLTNSRSYFGRFTKKVQGISLSGSMKTDNGGTYAATVAGALVKGIFSKSEFKGQEGNQGPYKLVGPNGELYIMVVSGSERVYVNGLLLKRGENEDYVIDYNAGEIKFNPTFPITSDMRILVEYQFTDRNYTRFIGYSDVNYTNEKLDIGLYAYSENDAKNQPLQQNLSEEQIAVLKAAGNDYDKMYAPSAIPDTYAENKILYKKIWINGKEVFVYSNDPEDELYNVRFSHVGSNNGNYVLSNQSAVNRIYEYVPPINNIPQGDHEPIIRLKPPEKLQIIGVNGRYQPSDKTTIALEMAVSNYDRNLFSNLDKEENVGFAGKVEVSQRVLTTSDSLKINVLGNIDVVQKEFQTIERLYSVEFDRDWNLINPEGSQRFLATGIEALHPQSGTTKYEFNNLNFSENFDGNLHRLYSTIHKGRLNFHLNSSLMESKADSVSSHFFRLNNTTVYELEKAWIGGKLGMENNKIGAINKNSLSPISHKFNSYEIFTGIGDSTDVYVQVGYNYRVTDSVRQNRLQRVNRANTYYLKSQLINSENTQLAAFVNYREIKYYPIEARDGFLSQTPETDEKPKERSLNSRILYNQSLWNGGVHLNTAIETNSGVVPQQEFTYIKTDPGQGVYIWVDYNGNGIQELDEFEVAQFPGQAEYIRILLPNQTFIKIRQNKFSQTLTLNPQVWKNEDWMPDWLTRFYNQTSYIIDRKVRRRDEGFMINPFKDGGADQLGLVMNFRNVIFFNRGRQRYTTSYTFLSSSNDNLLVTGLQRNDIKSHHLNFNHKLFELWLFNLKGSTDKTTSFSESLQNRNYHLRSHEINPKVSYLLNMQTRFDLFYHFKNKKNKLEAFENLKQQTLGVFFSYSNAEKISISGEFNYIDNNFQGNAYSPVAYQMLEGLQPGTNYTWQTLFQKRITQYLDANLLYFGRKSENSKAVHTGSVQLRAYF
ncbi:MAG: hypothetical protein GX163_12170 [Bacteroidetes bacterium]|nr:hypothetical protein [Bacteroidota bacterium]